MKRTEIQSQRLLQAQSRYPETPSELVIELREADYVAIGDPATLNKQAKREKVKAALTEELADSKAIAKRAGVSGRDTTSQVFSSTWPHLPGMGLAALLVRSASQLCIGYGYMRTVDPIGTAYDRLLQPMQTYRSTTIPLFKGITRSGKRTPSHSQHCSGSLVGVSMLRVLDTHLALAQLGLRMRLKRQLRLFGEPSACGKQFTAGITIPRKKSKQPAEEVSIARTCNPSNFY